MNPTRIEAPTQLYTENRPMKSLTSQEIAGLAGGTLKGPGDLVVSGVASLAEARPGDLSFLGNDKYEPQVLPSKAAVVLVPEKFTAEPPAGRAWIICKDASAAFMKIVGRFAPPPVVFAPGVHPTAVVHPTAKVADSAHIGACAVVEAGAVVGERSVIGAQVYVGQEVKIGDDCLIYPQVAVRERCIIGSRVIIHCGTTVGSDGFGYVPDMTGGLHTKIPQVGIVQIDDEVEVGANVAIDRARFGRTWIKRGAKIDNLVQSAHNVVVGELSFIIAQVGISGSTKIGRGCVLWGQVGVAGHLEIGDGAQVFAQSGVGSDVPPKAIFFGSPATERREFMRTQFNIHRIGKISDAVKALEKELAALKEQLPPKG